MKANHTLSLLGFLLSVLLGSLLVGRAAAVSDFSKTCDEITIADDGSWVEAKCNTPPMGPPWICSKLDLNLCLGNQAGRLVAQDSGEFTRLCKECGEAESLVIGCQCWSGQHHPGGDLVFYYSEFNLDNVVGNSNGYLRCFNHMASRSSGCS